jgi:hypothetical protein
MKMCPAPAQAKQFDAEARSAVGVRALGFVEGHWVRYGSPPASGSALTCLLLAVTLSP